MRPLLLTSLCFAFGVCTGLFFLTSSSERPAVLYVSAMLRIFGSGEYEAPKSIKGLVEFVTDSTFTLRTIYFTEPENPILIRFSIDDGSHIYRLAAGSVERTDKDSLKRGVPVMVQIDQEGPLYAKTLITTPNQDIQ